MSREERSHVVFVTGDINDAHVETIRAAAPSVTLEHLKDRTALDERIQEADIVAADSAQISKNNLSKAKRLRWLHTWSAGADKVLIPIPELLSSPITLTCSKSNGAIPLAEHAMMLMLMLNRNAVRWIRGQDQRRWDNFKHGELNGLTLGIIGLGNAGRDLALKAQAFHMHVLGLRRTAQPTEGVDEIYTRDRLHEMLGRSDFVVVAAPRTPETMGMLGESEFRAMKSTAFFIVFSRAGIAEDAALLRAVSEGWIAGAGLDAHSREPLPEDSPFWTAPNVIVTPHNGAGTVFTRQRGVEIFAENLRRYVSGEELLNVVDKEAGY